MCGGVWWLIIMQSVPVCGSQSYLILLAQMQVPIGTPFTVRQRHVMRTPAAGPMVMVEVTLGGRRLAGTAADAASG